MSYSSDNTKALMVGGTDTYTVSNNMTSYNSGDSILCIFTNANTGASTFNLNGLGAKAIQKNGATALVSGDIIAGQPYWLLYDGTDYQLTGSVGGGSESWQPPTLSLGDGATSGVSVFGKSAGNFYSFDGGNSADAWSANKALDHNGIAYDGSNLALKIHYKPSTGGSGSDTIFWDCNYAFLKVGDNGQTKVTVLTQKSVDVSAWTQDLQQETQLDNMTGEASATHISIDFTRDSIAGSGDAFSGDAEVTAIELIKV